RLSRGVRGADPVLDRAARLHDLELRAAALRLDHPVRLCARLLPPAAALGAVVRRALTLALCALLGVAAQAQAQVSPGASGDTIHVARGPARQQPRYLPLTTPA